MNTSQFVCFPLVGNPHPHPHTIVMELGIEGFWEVTGMRWGHEGRASYIGLCPYWKPKRF